MNNDPSTAITSTIAPAPEVIDSISREGNIFPLPTQESGDTPPAPDATPPDMVKTVGGTTFEIYFHFSQTSKETFTDGGYLCTAPSGRLALAVLRISRFFPQK